MNTQPEALAVAGDLEIQSDKVNGSVKYSTAKKAAVLLRTQHADLERKDALLRQALEVFSGYVLRTGLRHEVIDTITSELSK